MSDSLIKDKKKELRAQIKQKIKIIPKKQLQAISFNPILTRYKPKTIFAFYPLEDELSIHSNLTTFLSLGIKLALPRIIDSSLFFYTISSLHLAEKGSYGIFEPPATNPCIFSPEINKTTVPIIFPLVVLVPAVAYSPNGQRLGRGKGFYDRFIAQLYEQYKEQTDKIHLVGLCHESQIIQNLPTEDHDCKVHCLITNKSCIFVEDLS